MRKTPTPMLWLALAALTLAGCNTAEGIGKDIEAGGKVIKESAKDVKKKL